MSEPADEAVPPEIVAYYRQANEAGRLDGGIGLVERHRTRQLVQRFLSSPPAVVLDIGGAAGIHAMWLAEAGYEVHLSDPVPDHVEEAKIAAARRGVELGSATVGHAGALNHGDASVDAVLGLGPLYHLPDPGDRRRALDEAVRVLRPGGWFFGAAISRFTSMINAIREGLLTDTDFLTIVDGDLVSGRHDNVTGNPDFFTTAFVHHPDELAGELIEAGLCDVEVFAVEGLAWAVDDIDAVWADARARRQLLQLLERTEREPALLGASTHLLGVGRRPP